MFEARIRHGLLQNFGLLDVMPISAIALSSSKLHHKAFSLATTILLAKRKATDIISESTLLLVTSEDDQLFISKPVRKDASPGLLCRGIPVRTSSAHQGGKVVNTSSYPAAVLTRVLGQVSLVYPSQLSVCWIIFQFLILPPSARFSPCHTSRFIPWLQYRKSLSSRQAQQDWALPLPEFWHQTSGWHVFSASSLS